LANSLVLTMNILDILSILTTDIFIFYLKLSASHFGGHLALFSQTVGSF
jgi:hypothetical protein